MLLLLPCFYKAQKTVYTRADSLRGTYGPARAWWDVLHYDLSVVFAIGDSSISGINVMTYRVLESADVMQIDLMTPMEIDSIVQDGKSCSWKRDGNAFFVNMPVQAAKQSLCRMKIYFHGKPRVAKNAPWDGGFIWTADKKGFPWISLACQGMAAQVWFPNKDHQADEPDSVLVNYSVPKDLFAVGNGRLKSFREEKNGMMTYSWEIKNPINNYNIVPYIGRYIPLKDTLNGRAGTLDMDFWVLQENYEKARAQFTQAKSMLRCFEYWFGKYPFYEDGYKLVEAPFLGMEHQSAIAYGNDFRNGYQGRDLSQTGWGLKWDFIIVHESGHEWFGNNITAKDVADNWIHESFTAYSENLYTEYLYGRQAGAEYVIGTRKAVLNDKPIIGDYGVNAGGSLDLYYKGANMLHTIRQLISNDSLWRDILQGLNRGFYHQTVSTRQVEDYLKKYSGLNLQPVFDQYLRTTQIPVFEYRLRKNKLVYRWSSCNSNFNMPVEVLTAAGRLRLNPLTRWQTLRISTGSLSVVPDYFVLEKKLK